MVNFVNWVVLFLVMITSTGLLLIKNWRWSLGLLAVQYLGVFWMIQTHWPITMASTKLIMGWMACAVIGIAYLNKAETEVVSTTGFRRLGFQVLTTCMIIAVTFAASLKMVDWLGLIQPVSWAGLILMGLGLLHLGITSETFQIILGLLTLLAGFDIIYTAVESSALVTALMVVINLGLALAGAYFTNSRKVEETP
jgi:hypothetical protein